jgi:hypothetical protein
MRSYGVHSAGGSSHKSLREEWESAQPWSPTQERYFQGTVSSFLISRREKEERKDEKDDLLGCCCFVDCWGGNCSEKDGDYG